MCGMVACDDHPRRVRKPGYQSPPDPREAARKQFSKQLIAALEDARAGKAAEDVAAGAPVSLKRAARRAYEEMQFDFPVELLAPRHHTITVTVT